MADEFVPIIEIPVRLATVDRACLLDTLSRLAADDSQFRFVLDDTSQLILSGIDELQLAEKIDALRDIAGAEMSLDPPRIAYRETVMRRAEADYSHKKQRFGGGEYARVKLALDPSGPGYACQIRTAGAALPDEYIAGVRAGLERALRAGIVEGFPVVGVTATLLDGAYHEIDSSADAFAIAATAAVREALQTGGPVLLEPVMKVEVVAPADCVGQIVGDLAARRGELQVRAIDGSESVIVATVPATNLLGYANALRSMSGERARCKVRFDHYAPVPPSDDPPFRPAVGMRA